MLERAKIYKNRNGNLVFKSGYNALLVKEIHRLNDELAISGDVPRGKLRFAVWDKLSEQWRMPVHYEEKLREVVRLYFPIADEPTSLSPAVWERRLFIKQPIWRKRLSGGVSIDGCWLFDKVTFKPLPNSPAHELISWTHKISMAEDNRKKPVQAVTELHLLVRKDATWRYYNNTEITFLDSPLAYKKGNDLFLTYGASTDIELGEIEFNPTATDIELGG